MGLLDRCRIHNVKISRRKFKIGRSLEFGGFLIDGTSGELRIGPDPSRIEAIRSMKVPESKKQVREFLGVVWTLESWTPHIKLSTSTKLLRGLSRKDTKFYWSPELEQEFQEIQRVVSDVKILSQYNRGLPLQLFCDASREGGLGYVLVQPQGEKVNVFQCGSTTLISAPH